MVVYTKDPMNFLKKHISTFVFLFLLVGVRTTFANQYLVPTGSMEPTIAIGDRIFVNRVAYDLKLPFTNTILKRLGEPERGDVVVFDSPIQPGMVLVKRLVALPGDHLRFENGFIFLNGKRLDDFRGEDLYRERLGTHTYRVQRDPRSFVPEKREFVVPPAQYLMFGDNRDHSADSRVFGFVKRELLIGRASHVLFSMDFPSVKLERVGQKLD